MSIPDTQEEGAGREREAGGELGRRDQVRLSLFWLVVHNPPIAVACQNRNRAGRRDLMRWHRYHAAVIHALCTLGIQASRDDIIQPVVIGRFSLGADGDRWSRRGARYKSHLRQVRSEGAGYRVLRLIGPRSDRGCPAFRGRGDWRKNRFFSTF